MDPRLLEYYNVELQHLHEMGSEFASQFPKIAARLGMSGLEVADPYVERLLEGVAFLAARVQLKLHAEFPRFTQALLDIVYPHYLAPTPAMLVAQLQPDPNDPNLVASKTVPRGTSMTAVAGGEDRTACEFRIAHDVVLWPLQIVGASYFSFAPDLPLNAVTVPRPIKAGVRIRLKTGAGLKFAQLPLDRVSFYISGGDEAANRLHELCAGHTIGVLVLPAKGEPRRHTFLPGRCVRPVGFDDRDALLPVTLRAFQGYRLLQEYFAFPERYRFVDVVGLASAVKQSPVDEIELVLLFDRGQPGFESVVDKTHFSLFCTPSINLFPKRADRIHVSDNTHEYHVLPDRTRPMDFEIYDVTDVVGHGGGTDSDQTFLPLYTAYVSHRDREHPAYFTVRREPRLPSSSQKRRGARSSYIGTEVFLSLVDAVEAPFRSDLRQLSIQTLCTNRDLVLQMPIGLRASDFTLDVAAPVKTIRVVSGPSRPYAPLADGAVAWRAINHLSLNYLSLMNATPEQGAAALRELLDLYVPAANIGVRKQVDGVRAVAVRRIVRRTPGSGPIAFGRGVEITVSVDELAFEGASAFLLGAVLARYFAAHVSMNSFTETVLRSESRGEIQRWMPLWGARPTL
ncbi:MAG TPA: type VI secretion system baseplate subunit TssF [Vicinamibacterales bacterium]|nr:type VI secretion system baseplate subunit TssF [Vicinamibacterales bacterium]